MRPPKHSLTRTRPAVDVERHSIRAPTVFSATHDARAAALYDSLVPSDSLIAASVTDVLTRVIADVDSMARDLAAQIRRDVPYYSDPSVAADDLEDTCRGQLEAALSQLDLPDAMDGTAARINGAKQANVQVPLTSLIDAYRVGSHFIWTTVAAACAAEAVASEHVLALADRIWLVQDAFTQSMAEGYREVANARLLTEEAERASIVDALLQGQVLSQETLWDLATVLQLPQRGPFVVVAAEVADLGRHAMPAIESRLRANDVLSAWQLRPDTQVGIVHVPSLARQEALLAVLRLYPDVRLGVSPQYLKLDETAQRCGSPASR